MYLKQLQDPFSIRGVRMPTTMSVPCQIKNIHGSVTFVTNAAGYGRVGMSFAEGSILGYNDALHTETVLGA